MRCADQDSLLQAPRYNDVSTHAGSAYTHTLRVTDLILPLGGEHGGKVVLVAVADAPTAAVVLKPVPALPLENLLRPSGQETLGKAALTSLDHSAAPQRCLQQLALECGHLVPHLSSPPTALTTQPCWHPFSSSLLNSKETQWQQWRTSATLVSSTMMCACLRTTPNLAHAQGQVSCAVEHAMHVTSWEGWMAGIEM